MIKELIEKAMAEIKSEEEPHPTLITEEFLLSNGFEKKTDEELYYEDHQTFFVREFENGFQLIVKEETTGNYSLVIPSENPDGFTYEHLSFVHNLEKVLEAVEK